jgi:hypothetical protein
LHDGFVFFPFSLELRVVLIGLLGRVGVGVPVIAFNGHGLCLFQTLIGFGGGGALKFLPELQLGLFLTVDSFGEVELPLLLEL